MSNSKLEKDEALLYHFLSHRHNTERDLVLWSLGPEKEWFVRKSADMGDWYNGSIYVGDGFVMYEPMMRGESSLGLGLNPINIPKFLRVDRRFIPPFLIKTEPEHKETLEISQNKLNFIIHLSELFSVR